eukprot:CAMPEP_0184707806 /NCGR_PEP_ID=MMETSP0313-20130426/37456_1 /TAXON_ID=2792 /ORGANISM="Porphyridium aerugineum, Strain SAG 1380-2" /LENGTH=214 /DNA_ID=CAMNT_0027169387 /DNA_START=172 /DNA_END=813 /DNA_ORIENTATION=-
MSQSDASTSTSSNNSSIYQLNLDFGREKNTWMPPTWAISSKRILISLLVQLHPNTNTLAVLKTSSFCDTSFGPGTYNLLNNWRLPNNTSNMQMQIRMTELERGDLVLPSGTLFLTTSVYGNYNSETNTGNYVLGKKGVMSILQTRWLIRKEYRIVGTFECVRMEGDDSNDEEDGKDKEYKGRNVSGSSSSSSSSSSSNVMLPPLRVIAGSRSDW